LRDRQRLRRLLSGQTYDAYFVQSSALSILPGALFRKPVFTVLDATQVQLCGFGEYYGLRESWLLLERYKHWRRSTLYQSCSALFPISQWCADSLVADYGVPPDRIFVHQCGTNVNTLMPEAEVKSYLSARACRTVCNLLFVGGDFRRKGGELLLRWVRETKAMGWHLDIVTREQFTCEHPSVAVHRDLSPMDHRLCELFRQSDLFLYPTLADCSSIVVQEAAACAVPSIASQVGGVSDLIENGVSGWLVPPGDFGGFATILDQLVANGEKRLCAGRAARRKACAEFDFPKISESIVATMLPLIERRK